ncbi:MAG: DEAD/DEAH box helicase, partial [Erysipelotrichaceae bacterium]|nr:DEAD/DEAH box helicase [Erysipelotrichaceae bacterium]
MKTLKECKLTSKRIEILDKLGCTSVEEVLTYYPFRYEQIESKPFSEWLLKDKVVFEGTLITYPKTNRFSKGRTMSKFEVLFDDQEIEVTIFNRPWTSNLKMGQNITVFGRYEGKQRVTASTYNGKPLSEQLGIQPVYNLKEGITQKNVQDIIKKVFEGVYEEIENIVPEEFISNYRLLNRKDALRMLHFPKSMNEIKLANRTLKYEEFLKFNLAMQYLKTLENFKEVKVPKQINTDEVYSLTHHLKYDLTTDQIKAINEIMAEMNSSKIMYRLLQGDVGCGKTLVAILSLYANYLAHYQGAFLAPTEILAKQHYQSIRELLRPTNAVVEVIYSSLPNVVKKDIYERLSKGEIDILVGTHALLQDSVVFKKLGYVVVDEQQRFGVEQRKKIKEKGKNVDFLLMSATPIPRTLANTLYGDMDITTIETMPKGRVPAETILVQKNSIKPIVKDLERILAQGHQLYVICASIEDNENYTAKNVNEIADALAKYFKNYKIGMLHGQMSSDEKDEVMNAFAKNETQILVSTTV